MKISVSFPELTDQRIRLGAALSSWKISAPSINPRLSLLNDLDAGIEVNISDLEIGPGKLLTYQREQVLLYIKDTRSSLEELINEPENSRRFHIAECQTLADMRRKGRFERYVVTNRMTGVFKVDWLNSDTKERGETQAELKVCKNCLKELNWRGYDRPSDRLMFPDGTRLDRNGIWETFSISEFLMDYSTFFHSKPKRRDDNAGLNNYVQDWPQISELKRRQAKWRCEQCSVDLSAHPSVLHCHHRNGVVTDNSFTNLMVLCALCHAAQPSHGHMHVLPRDKQTITRARIEQRL